MTVESTHEKPITVSPDCLELGIGFHKIPRSYSVLRNCPTDPLPLMDISSERLKQTASPRWLGSNAEKTVLRLLTVVHS